MGHYDSRGRSSAPVFPWDVTPRAPARRGAPEVTDDDATAAKPAMTALVPVQFGVGAFRAPVSRVSAVAGAGQVRRAAPVSVVGSRRARVSAVASRF